MRIGINARFLIKDRLEGLGRYCHEILSRIVKNHPEHEFVFFFDREFSAEFIYASNVKGVIVSPPARHPFLWYLWFEWALSKAINKEKIDYFISPDSFLSLKTSVPQHLVVHDLAFEHHPEGIPFLVSWFYKKFSPLYCNKANRIIAVSQYTKEDICKQYGISSGKIDAVLNGVSSDFKKVEFIDNKYLKESNLYFVYVGAMHPRKNISNLLRAFEAFKQTDNAHTQLVLVGRKAWQNKEMEVVFESMQYKDSVVFTGRISDEKLVGVLSGAIALTYIPFFEGFGLPIVEAQACGTPVICSNTSSMPEVIGDGGLLVDPNNPKEIENAMKQMAKVEIRADFARKSIENASRFDWETSAELFWKSIEKGMADAHI